MGTDPNIPLQPASPEAQAAQLSTQPATIEQSSSGPAEARHALPDNARMTPLFGPPAPLYPGVCAAYPGAQLPKGTKILAGYVGIPGQGNASPDTPNIWSAAEWNHYAEADPDLRLLPIFVHNYADGQPEVDGANAVAAVAELGWSTALTGEAERIIVIDAETLVDYEYFGAMGEAISRAGFRPVIYGSASTVRGNPAFGGYWMADFNNTHAPTALASGNLGVQWKPGGSWNLSVFSQDMYFGCGHGPRHA
jgi:hypothetical protein